MSQKLKQSSEKEVLENLAPFFGCTCYEELKLKEAIMNKDASEMFREYCKENLGYDNMRLDLFYD